MKSKMLRGIVACSIFASSAVFAYSCPMDMRNIDIAIASSTLSPADLDKVKAHRSRGEKLHRKGDHDGAETALSRAKKLLGI